MEVLLDTSVAIALREAEPAILERAAELANAPLLSVISVVELEGGVPFAPEGTSARRRARLMTFCAHCTSCPSSRPKHKHTAPSLSSSAIRVG